MRQPLRQPPESRQAQPVEEDEDVEAGLSLVHSRKNTATIECASSWRNAEGVIVQDYALNTRSEIEGGHGKKAHDQESIDDVRLELRAIDDQLRHHVHLAKKEADASLKDIGLAPELTHPVEKATAAVANTRTSGSILLQVPGDDGGNNMPRQYGVDIGTKGQQHSRRTDKLQPCMRPSSGLPSCASPNPGSNGRASSFLHPYPFTDAVYLPQGDVLDDGLPPIPRAITSQQPYLDAVKPTSEQNLEVTMLIQDGKHLPDVTMDAMSSSPQSPALGGISNVSGKLGSPHLSVKSSRIGSPVTSLVYPVTLKRSCSSGPLNGEDDGNSSKLTALKGTLFALEVSYNGQACFTEPKRSSSSNSCVWLEQFNLLFAEEILRPAYVAASQGTDGPLLQVKLHNSGLYSGQDVIGLGKVAIKDLLKLQEGVKGSFNVRCLLEDPATGRRVLGVDGKQTEIQLAFYAVHHPEVWTIPTLEETLRACDSEKIVLRPARLFRSRSTRAEYLGLAGERAKRLLRKLSSFEGSKPGRESPNGRELFSKGQSLPYSREKECPNDDDLGCTSAKELMSKEGDLEISTRQVNRESTGTFDFPAVAIVDRRTDRDVEFYWREELEKVMDSLFVNLLVVVLVAVDIMMILVVLLDAHISASGVESVWVFHSSMTIVSLLMVQLTLRQIAMGQRFWKERWNQFDFVVIWLSFLMIVARLIVNAQFDQKGPLSVIARVAIGLRVLRVVANFRRVRKVIGEVVKNLRIAVSQNKRRYVKDGFDLDLTYITDRVIAMSAPAFGQTSSYRNDVHVVSRFLASRHYGSFFIFNLCDTFYSSDGIIGQYHPSMLFDQVQRIPFEDHGPPLMAELLAFCEEAQAWMQADLRNVVVCHCKGGKGRTGLMVAALLLWSGHRKTALDALELFTFRRTRNYNPKLGMDSTHKHFLNTTPCNQTVEGPSQIRYVHYLEATLYSGIEPLGSCPVLITSITVPNDKRLLDSPWYLSFTIGCCRYPVYDSILGEGGSAVHVLGGTRDKEWFTLPVNVVVWGDVRLEFYEHTSLKEKTKRKLAFFMIFNTAFYTGRKQLMFKKDRIDILGKDQQHKIVTANFHMLLNFDLNPTSDLVLKYEQEFWLLVKTHGVPVSFKKGDIVVEETTSRSSLVCIESGNVEGVCYDTRSGHPLGRTACEVILKGRSNERIPATTRFGPKSIVGISPFLSLGNTMAFRAKSDVSGFELFREEIGDRRVEGCPEGASSASSAYTGQTEDVLGIIGVKGVSHDVLYKFYRGMSVTLARRLSRIQVEMIRIGSLPSFKDRRLKLGDDMMEKIRESVIQKFCRPMHEKIILSTKCRLRSPRKGDQQMRLIIFSSDVFFDPNFYGSEISSKSLVFPYRLLHSVSPHETAPCRDGTTADHSMDLRVACESSHKVKTYVITFPKYDTYRDCYDLLSTACKTGEVLRQDETHRPFESPCMAELLERCSIVHRVKAGDKLHEACMSKSLFLICSGECRLITRDGRCFTVLREGLCIGEINFTLGCSAGNYECVANVPSTVLEIPPVRVRHALHDDKMLSACFYSILCRSMEKQIRNLSAQAFPGTWSRHASGLRISTALLQEDKVGDRTSIGTATDYSAIKITRGDSILPSHLTSVQESRDEGTRPMETGPETFTRKLMLSSQTMWNVFTRQTSEPQFLRHQGPAHSTTASARSSLATTSVRSSLATALGQSYSVKSSSVNSSLRSSPGKLKRATSVRYSLKWFPGGLERESEKSEPKGVQHSN